MWGGHEEGRDHKVTLVAGGAVLWGRHAGVSAGLAPVDVEVIMPRTLPDGRAGHALTWEVRRSIAGLVCRGCRRVRPRGRRRGCASTGCPRGRSSGRASHNAWEVSQAVAPTGSRLSAAGLARRGSAGRAFVNAGGGHLRAPGVPRPMVW